MQTKIPAQNRRGFSYFVLLIFAMPLALIRRYFFQREVAAGDGSQLLPPHSGQTSFSTSASNSLPQSRQRAMPGRVSTIISVCA